ncbi:MAG TPA: hypothetical protein VFQ42_22540 [Mycobacterium sp.]|nr:hypothetical protein [Mycobacterium sp.]
MSIEVWSARGRYTIDTEAEERAHAAALWWSEERRALMSDHTVVATARELALHRCRGDHDWQPVRSVGGKQWEICVRCGQRRGEPQRPVARAAPDGLTRQVLTPRRRLPLLALLLVVLALGGVAGEVAHRIADLTADRSRSRSR